MPVADLDTPTWITPTAPIVRRGIAAWSVGHRRWIVAAWVTMLALLAPAAGRVDEVLDVSARVEHSESAAVDELLRTRFASPFARHAVVVLTGVADPRSDSGAMVLGDVVRAVRAVPGVTGTISWLDAHDSLFAPAHGAGTFVVVGVDATDNSADAMVPLLRAATTAASDRLRSTYPSAALRWTGDIVLNYDIRRTSAAEGQRAERRALPRRIRSAIIGSS